MMWLLISSCNKDPLNNPNQIEDGYTTIQLSTPMFNNANTKGFSDIQEVEMKNIEVLLFSNPSGTTSALTFLTSLPLLNVDQANKTLKVMIPKTNTNVAILIIVRGTLSQNTTVLNAKGESYSTVIERYKYDWTDKVNTTEGYRQYLPMSGLTMLSSNITPTTKNINIALGYSLSRIDVGVNFTGEGLTIETATGLTNFELVSVEMKNISAKGYVVPTQNNSALPSIPSNPGTIPTEIVYNLPALSTNKAIIREIYLPETHSSTNPYILIGGKFNGSTTITYYKIKFIDNGGNSLHLLRGYRYQVNITKIISEGGSTPQTATSLNITSSITLWDSNSTSIGEHNDNKLEIDKTSIQIGRLAQTVTNAATIISNDSEINISVNSEASSWLSASIVPISGNRYGLKLITSSANNTLFPRNATITLKKYAINTTIKVEQLPLIANDPKRYSNCIIVTPGSGSQIQAINIPEPLSTQLSAGVWWMTVPSLITDVTYNLTTGQISFKTKDAEEGNAVIALKSTVSGTETVLWSWHIWVTYDKQKIEAGEPSGGRYMDRNIGALSNTTYTYDGKSYGMCYQWGRKDPFPMAALSVRRVADGLDVTEMTMYNSSDQPFTMGNRITPTSQTNGTIQFTIKSPDSFLTGNTQTGDWLYVKNDNLWGQTKTIFDPCPAGWRVPYDSRSTADGWTGVSFTLSNYQAYTSSGFGKNLPYAGIRLGTPNTSPSLAAGKLISVGNKLFNWYSEKSDTNDAQSKFNTNGSNIFQISNVGKRSNGMPVRCVQDTKFGQYNK